MNNLTEATYFVLAILAGYTPAQAENLGLSRSELISIINSFNQLNKAA